MAKYRKVETRIWNDEKFNSLSAYGKLSFLFILTHPHMTPLGAMRGTMEGLCSELNEVPLESFQEVFSKSFVKYSPKDCFIILPNFLKYNSPESPNVVKSWVGSWENLPECELKVELLLCLKDYVEGLGKGLGKGSVKDSNERFKKAFNEAFGEAAAKAFPKGMPIQEQEQEF